MSRQYFYEEKNTTTTTIFFFLPNSLRRNLELSKDPLRP